MERARERARQFSGRPVAGPDSSAVLQLSRDGGTGDDFYCGAGAGSPALLEEEIVWLALDAVDFDAVRAFAVHCEHRGMDDGGNRAAAVADLWVDADGAWGFATSGRGKCMVHTDRVYGSLHGAGDFVVRPDWAGNSYWP